MQNCFSREQERIERKKLLEWPFSAQDFYGGTTLPLRSQNEILELFSPLHPFRQTAVAELNMNYSPVPGIYRTSGSM